MKLPYGDKVLISREKLLNYVLSETHSTGKFKAKFFQKVGFNRANVDVFEKALRKIAKSEEVKDMIFSEYGAKYILDGKLESPTGKIVKVRTIWIVEQGQKRPRFVTVYPV